MNHYPHKEVQRLDAIDRLLQGSIDMHAHYGPHPNEKLRCDALKGAQSAGETRHAGDCAQEP